LATAARVRAGGGFGVRVARGGVGIAFIALNLIAYNGIHPPHVLTS
jgi:hypothetical protein